MLYKKFSKQKQICWHLQLLGGNKTKVTNAKSCIYKTKYGEMVVDQLRINSHIYIVDWATII